MCKICTLMSPLPFYEIDFIVDKIGGGSTISADSMTDASMGLNT